MPAPADSRKSAAPKLWLHIVPKFRQVDFRYENAESIIEAVEMGTITLHVSRDRITFSWCNSPGLPVANANQRIPLNTGGCESPTPQIMLAGMEYAPPISADISHSVPFPPTSPTIRHLGSFSSSYLYTYNHQYPQSSLFIFPLDDPTRE
jgi:hypothetical protein